MVCLPVRGDKPQYLGSRLSALHVDSHGLAIYNQATSNLAIYSHEHPKISCQKFIIVIQVHDELHEKLFISTCSFL